MASRRRGVDLIRAEIKGAGGLARDFDRASRVLQRELTREMRYLSARALAATIRAAPVDSGDLVEGLDIVHYRTGERLRFTVIAPTKQGHSGAEDGYPYVAVTRFGHRKERIYAKPLSMLSVHAPGRASIASFEHSVRGVRVSHDWVEVASLQVDSEVGGTEQRLARAVDLTLGTGRIK